MPARRARSTRRRALTLVDGLLPTRTACRPTRPSSPRRSRTFPLLPQGLRTYLHRKYRFRRPGPAARLRGAARATSTRATSAGHRTGGRPGERVDWWYPTTWSRSRRPGRARCTNQLGTDDEVRVHAVRGSTTTPASRATSAPALRVARPVPSAPTSPRRRHWDLLRRRGRRSARRARAGVWSEIDARRPAGCSDELRHERRRDLAGRRSVPAPRLHASLSYAENEKIGEVFVGFQGVRPL